MREAQILAVLHKKRKKKKTLHKKTVDGDP